MVPPDIDNNKSSDDIILKTGETANLECRANGYPAPTISWIRDKKFPAQNAKTRDTIKTKDPETGVIRYCMYRSIISFNVNLIETSHRISKLLYYLLFIFYVVESYNGPILSIPRVTPDDLGAYLCIAKNGVQPSMSKRVVVYVQCNSFSYILKRIIIHCEVDFILFLLIMKSILLHNHKRLLTLSERLTSNSSYRFRVLHKYLFDEYLYHLFLFQLLLWFLYQKR